MLAYRLQSMEAIMADAPVVHIGENSPEYVAYRLLRDIAGVEEKSKGPAYTMANADRKWILDTYAECLHTVKGYRDLSS